MTTKEFIKKVKELDFVGEVLCNYGSIRILDGRGSLLAVAYPNKRYHISTDRAGFECLSEDKQHRLFKLCTKYAFTPVKKRNITKYQLLFKIDNDVCLNIDDKRVSEAEHFWLEKMLRPCFAKNTFTQAEIDEIKAKYGEDCLGSFEQVEVKE